MVIKMVSDRASHGSEDVLSTPIKTQSSLEPFEELLFPHFAGGAIEAQGRWVLCATPRCPPKLPSQHRNIQRGVTDPESCDLISPSQFEWPDWVVTEAAGAWLEEVGRWCVCSEAPFPAPSLLTGSCEWKSVLPTSLSQDILPLP